jgi:hypothetical protein
MIYKKNQRDYGPPNDYHQPQSKSRTVAKAFSVVSVYED